MNAPTMQRQTQSNDVSRGATRRVAQVLIVLLIQAVILFGLAGRMDWLGAWLYLISYVTGLVFTFVFVIRKNPGLAAERGRIKADAKTWDKWLALLVSLVGPLSTLAVAGLDQRYGWTGPVAAWIPWAGLAVNLLGYALTSWAMASNNFFSGVVRIQTDRGHTVATAGPYHFVRHPGYTGMITFNLAAPLLLGSAWALVPALVTVGLFVLRTVLEDRTLQAELPGYREYAQRTRYRLLPGVW